MNHPFNNDYPAWMLKPENTTPNDNYPSLLSKVTSIALNDDEVLHIETEMLREHIGLPRKPGGEQPVLPKMQPLFFIEKTPYSAQNGVLCKLRTCRKHVIRPGEYCVALDPPMGIRSNTQDSPERAGSSLTILALSSIQSINILYRFLPRLLLREGCRSLASPVRQTRCSCNEIYLQAPRHRRFERVRWQLPGRRRR